MTVAAGTVCSHTLFRLTHSYMSAESVKGTVCSVSIFTKSEGKVPFIEASVNSDRGTSELGLPWDAPVTPAVEG